MYIPMQANWKDGPIAVFDSGMGGISVLRALVRLMPQENFLYFGDSANAPYGSRPAEQIRELTLLHAQRLFESGAKALVIACNTATSIAVQQLRERYPERIIIGIEPALKPAVEAFPNGKILVMATETTLREKKFEELTEQYAQSCDIMKCPCPEFVEFVERGELESEKLLQAIRKRLQQYEKPDAIVLGCTHFPFLRKAISTVAGEDISIFDGADGTAKETHRRILQEGLLREGEGSVMLTNSLAEMWELSNQLLHAKF